MLRRFTLSPDCVRLVAMKPALCIASGSLASSSSIRFAASQEGVVHGAEIYVRGRQRQPEQQHHLRQQSSPSASPSAAEEQEVSGQQQQLPQQQQREQPQRSYPIITSERMAEIRHMIEGRDPRGIPAVKFGGFFEDTTDVPGSYNVSLRELEDLIMELGTHRTPDELDLDAMHSFVGETSSEPAQQQQQQQQQHQEHEQEHTGSHSSHSQVVSNNRSDSSLQNQQRQENGVDILASGLPAARPSTVAKLFPGVSDERWAQVENSIRVPSHELSREERLQQQLEQEQLTPHLPTRSPHVTDSIERRLLLAFCIFKLNFVVEPPGAEEPATREVNPRMYMRFVAGGIGYATSRDILQQILAEEMPMNPEVIRYHTELALVLDSGRLMRDAILFARGESLSDEDADYFFGGRTGHNYLALREMCATAIITSVGDFIFKRCVIALLEGEGEGDASRSTIEVLSKVLPMLPVDMQAPMVQHLVDEAQLMISEAGDRRLKLRHYERERIHCYDTTARDEQLEMSAEVMCQSAAAVLKAISGSECCTVIDKSGALHFEIACTLFSALRSLERMSESCGVAEETMRFYEAHKETLKLEHQKRMSIAEARHNNNTDATSPDSNNNRGGENGAGASTTTSASVDSSAEGKALVKQRPTTKFQVESDDPTAENSSDQFELMHRRIYFQYLTDRAKTDPESGFHNILAACERHPRSAEAFRLLSLCLFRLGRHDEALSAIDRSVLLNPINPHFHRLRAHVLYQLKEYLTAEREKLLADILHDSEEGLRPLISPQDVLHATGPLLVEADQRREALKAELHREHNGDPSTMPQLPADMETALALRSQRCPLSNEVISAEASELLTELVNVQLPDTEMEMRHYLGQMRRHHIYTKQGPKLSAPTEFRVPELHHIQHEKWGLEERPKSIDAMEKNLAHTIKMSIKKQQ